MESTYDPILSGPEQLPYLQLRPLAPPRLGTALVLISAQGTLITCPAGSPVPAVRFGNYRSVYCIDTTEHQLVLTAQLPSSDPGFVFQAHVTYRCKVTDPADIAARQIHNVGELLRPFLIPLMRNATRRLDIAESATAEETIQRILSTAACDPAVEISSCSVEFPVRADEAESSGKEFRDTHRTNRITGMKSGAMRDLLIGGSPDLLALHLANHPEDTGPIMEMIVAGDIAEAQNMLQAISIMYGRNGADEEPFETREERKKLMDRFLARALPAAGRYVGGSGAGPDERRSGGSRLRGTLSREIDDQPRVAIGKAFVEKEETLRSPLAGRATEHSGGPERDGRPSDSARDNSSSRLATPRVRRHDPDADEA